jgi:hypothetical protein
MDVKKRKTSETMRIGLRPNMLPSGTQKMFEVPSNSVVTYWDWFVSCGASLYSDTSQTYSYQLRELADGHVRNNLELHDGECRSDSTSRKISSKRIEAHCEEDGVSATAWPVQGVCWALWRLGNEDNVVAIEHGGSGGGAV